jgi:hypothetical protein
MSDRPEMPQQAFDDAGGCLRCVAGLAIGVLAALGTTYTWYHAGLASGETDREGGGAMLATFIVFPLLAVVLGVSGVVIAWLTRKKRDGMSDKPKRPRRWILWTLLAVFVAYPLRAIPANLAVEWLRKHSQGDYSAVVDLIYAPVEWPFKKMFGGPHH